MSSGLAMLCSWLVIATACEARVKAATTPRVTLGASRLGVLRTAKSATLAGPHSRSATFYWAPCGSSAAHPPSGLRGQVPVEWPQEQARLASGGPARMAMCVFPCITIRILPLQHAEAQHLREVSRGEGGAAVARAARELHGSKVGQLVRR